MQYWPLCQFVLLGAVPFRRDVTRLQKLGVHGVITLNEPFETLVPSSMYKASEVIFPFHAKRCMSFCRFLIPQSFIKPCICHWEQNCWPKLFSTRNMLWHKCSSAEIYSHVGLITLLFLQEIICLLLHLWILIKLLISFIVSDLHKWTFWIS